MNSKDRTFTFSRCYEDVTSNVYPLTPNALEHLLEMRQDYEPEYNDITFISLHADEMLWSKEHSEYIPYTGNDSNPECYDSVYVSKALIIL